MCRTIRMHPTDYITIGPLKGLTFLPDHNLFDYEAPENECYCPATATGTILTCSEKKIEKFNSCLLKSKVLDASYTYIGLLQSFFILVQGLMDQLRLG